MKELLRTALEMRRNGGLQESNKLLKDLALQHPEHALLHYECARSYDILALEKEAIHFYERALELGISGKEGVDAYAQLGSMYRLRRQLAESENVLMDGIIKFEDMEENGLLKTLYAFTMYDLGKTSDAMRWMTNALLDTSMDQGIMDNRRMLQYLGSNMDVPDIMEKLRDHPDEIETPNDQKTIAEKVEAVLKVFEPTYFHGGWGPDFDHYEQHFTDPDLGTRRAAIAAFAIMAGVWETLSAFYFTPQHERKYSGGYYPDEPHYELNGYIHAFHSNFNAIYQEFPVMTAYIVDSLSSIDERSKRGLESEFPEMDPVLFKKFREEILMPYRTEKKKLPPLEDFLVEIGWNSSYRGW